MDCALSGIIAAIVGAIAGSLVTIIYLCIAELKHQREKAFIEIISWLDEVYDLVQLLHAEKENHFSGKGIYLTDEEREELNKELKKKLLSSKIPALIALAYGEENELGNFKSLRDGLTQISRKLWTADEKNWSSISNEIRTKFEEVIDPLRSHIERSLLMKIRWDSFLSWALPPQILPNAKKLFAKVLYPRTRRERFP